MAKFLSKPTEIEAEQWFPGKEINGVIGATSDHAFVVTIQGRHVKVSPGEWIITESDGIHHYPCDPVVFSAKYDPAFPSDSFDFSDHDRPIHVGPNEVYRGNS